MYEYVINLGIFLRPYRHNLLTCIPRCLVRIAVLIIVLQSFGRLFYILKHVRTGGGGIIFMLLFTHVYKAALFSIDSDESAVAILGNTFK